MDQNFKVKLLNGSSAAVSMVQLRGGKHRVSVQQQTPVPRAHLDRLAEERKNGGRAPLGDSHGAWQKVAEIPLSLLFNKIPADAWQDQKAVAKLLNDPDLRAFRTDGDHRRF